MPPKKQTNLEDDIVCDPDAMVGNIVEGEIIECEVADGVIEQAPDRIYIQYKVGVDFTQDGTWSIDYPYSKRKDSVWGSVIQALKEIGIVISKPSDLIGYNIRFEERTLEFGGDFNWTGLIPAENLSE